VRPESITFFRHYKNHKNNVQKEERKKRESKISQPIIDYLIDIVQRDKYISIDKMISEIFDCFHVEISRSYTYEIIHRLNYTYKKVQIRNQPYSNEEFSVMKEAFFKKIEGIDIGKIISIDETSICLHSKNSYAWALKGCNCTFINKTNKIYQCRYTLLMAISNSQVILYGLYEKSVNGTIFMNFVKEIISKYGNYYTLLMDNAVIHKTKLFNAYAKKRSINILYNIPYNPQTNPIEMIFHPIKNHVRKNDTNNIDFIEDSIDEYISTIKEDTLKGMFDRSLHLNKDK